MSKKSWRKGVYAPKNLDKYVGKKYPTLRSQWEFDFADFCDNHDSVLEWASEPLKIPYTHPFKKTNTGQPLQTVYVPDFWVKYKKKSGKIVEELVEIKPKDQAVLTENSSKTKKLLVAVNHAKWKAAMKFAQRNGFKFRVMTEENLYAGYKK